MTPDEICTLCCEWQIILRLQDWQITLDVVDFLPGFGCTQWDRYKNAHIQLCSAHTISPNQITSQDMEVTLVHELLHLHFKPFDRAIKHDSAEDDAMEEVIEILAQSLVSLKRAGRLTKKAKK